MLLLFLSFPLIHSLSIFSSFLSTSPSFSHCQPRRPLLIVNYDADASPEMHHHLTTPLLHRGAGGQPAWPWPGYSGLSLHQVAPCRHFWLHSCPGQSRCQETIGQMTKNTSLDKGGGVGVVGNGAEWSAEEGTKELARL